MGMGIVSPEDFESEVQNSGINTSIPSPSLLKPVQEPVVLDSARIEELERPGRSEGDNNTPDSLRKIIGEESEINGRKSALEIASRFGISPSSVSAYANGSTSTKSYDKRPNLDFLNDRKIRITRKAVRKLATALDCITDEKLENADLKDIATVARSMSAVIKEMEPEIPKESIDKGSGPTFVFYAPQIREENHYEVIQARE